MIIGESIIQYLNDTGHCFSCVYNIIIKFERLFQDSRAVHVQSAQIY